jgi:hypothetical protein
MDARYGYIRTWAIKYRYHLANKGQIEIPVMIMR